MAVIVDTGILYAYYDRSDAWHRRARAIMEAEAGGLIVPAPVIPEVDYLLFKRIGAKAQFAFWQGLSGGAYFVADLPREGYGRIIELNRRHATLELGFVDAAVVAIAEGLGLRRIATTDRRHFEPLAQALAIELVPARG